MGPLAGIRVLDLGQFIAGPYVGALLAEMGAEVIKVESPAGDPFRVWDQGAWSPTFAAYNRGKKSVVLDLKQPRERQRFGLLAQSADVLVENFRPGVMRRMGIDYDSLRPTCPRLVYCAISGFGNSGPYAERPSYDTVAQALGGLTWQLMDPQRPRIRGPALADLLTGMFGAMGVCAALAGRSLTGAGQLVEVNMLQALVFFGAEGVYKHLMTGVEPGPHTRPADAQAYAFVAADGRPFALHLSSPPKFWNNLCAAVGRPQWRSDPRFAERGARIRNHDALQEELQAIFATRPRDAWLRTLVEHEVPCAPIHRVGETVADPQVRHLGLVQADLQAEEGIPGLRGPIGFSAARGAAALGRPPHLGEHTAEILDGLS